MVFHPHLIVLHATKRILELQETLVDALNDFDGGVIVISEQENQLTNDVCQETWRKITCL